LAGSDFDEMYADVARYCLDPDHHPDLAHGRVQIEYGDAKAYFPAWVYLRDQLGHEPPSAFELQVAEEMHARYEEGFSRLEKNPFALLRDFNLAMDAAIGIEGIFRAYEHCPQERYRDLARRYLRLARPLARRPGLLYHYHLEPYGPVTVLAGAAWFYLEYRLAIGPDDPFSAPYQILGLDIIAKLDRNLYDASGRKYLFSTRPGYDFTYLYNNAVMVQALTRAYALTGEERYYERAREIMDTLEEGLFDREAGGFLAAAPQARFQAQYEKVNPLYNHAYMALSAHNYMVYAYLSLWEAGGRKDEALLDKAAVCLAFERDRLWDRGGKIQHHLAEGVLSGPEDYCMGCNFQTLYHIVQLKAARAGLATQGLIPRPSR
jgi:hypothetical protein